MLETGREGNSCSSLFSFSIAYKLNRHGCFSELVQFLKIHPSWYHDHPLGMMTLNNGKGQGRFPMNYDY